MTTTAERTAETTAEVTAEAGAGRAVERTRSARRGGRAGARLSARIVRAAFALFAERGFEATSLQDVAEAAELDLDAVARHYASTSDVVWEAQDRALRVLAGELDAVPEGVPWRSALVEVVLATQHHPGEDVALLRQRVQMTSEIGVLVAEGAARAERAQQALAAFVARRTAADPDDLEPFTLARAVWAANEAGLRWWARTGRDDPRMVVRASLEAIGFSSL